MFKIFSTPQAIAAYLSQQLVEQIKSKPASVLGLATGSTMEPIYQCLVEQLRQENTNLSQITTFNLDEYVGLGPEHPQSYHYYMYLHLFGKVPVAEARACLPRGKCVNLEEECRDYSRRIQDAGGLDIQLLGIGTNGHIGFNEPGTPFDSTTHVVELSENTRLDNGRFFDDPSQMPTHAITMGIRDIMQAKRIVLVATGRHKAQVMLDLYNSPPDENMPASILKQHPNIDIYLDEDAAGLLVDARSRVLGSHRRTEQNRILEAEGLTTLCF